MLVDSAQRFGKTLGRRLFGIVYIANSVAAIGDRRICSRIRSEIHRARPKEDDPETADELSLNH